MLFIALFTATKVHHSRSFTKFLGKNFIVKVFCFTFAPRKRVYKGCLLVWAG